MLNWFKLQLSTLAALTGCQTFCACARRKSWRLTVLGFVLITLRVGAAETDLSETNLISPNTKLWTESMLWGEQVSLYSGLGYNNNVLLSASNPQGCGFFVNGLDLVVTRLPLDGWQVTGTLTGDDDRYWRNVVGTDGVGTSREDSFLSSVAVERELPAGWQTGLEARGLYEHQVLDVPLSDGIPTTTLVDGYGITGEPYVRKDLPAGFWLKLQFPVTRWLFSGELDDYWDFGPVLTAGHDFGNRGNVALSYAFSYQSHDRWMALDAFGGPLSKRLELAQHQAELAWNQYWDTHRRWHTSTRLIFAYLEDNGGGYFNYYQYQAIEDLRWEGAGWVVKGSGQITYQDYPIQTIEGEHGSNPLFLNLLDMSLEVQRRLYKDLKCFAKLEYQRAISNEANSAGQQTGIFSDTAVSGGLRFEF